MADMQNAYVKLDKVSKIYQMGEVEIKAVDEISFEISKGEFVVIVGPSGAGNGSGMSSNQGGGANPVEISNDGPTPGAGDEEST